MQNWKENATRYYEQFNSTSIFNRSARSGIVEVYQKNFVSVSSWPARTYLSYHKSYRNLSKHTYCNRRSFDKTITTYVGTYIKLHNIKDVNTSLEKCTDMQQIKGPVFNPLQVHRYSHLPQRVRSETADTCRPPAFSGRIFCLCWSVVLHNSFPYFKKSSLNAPVCSFAHFHITGVLSKVIRRLYVVTYPWIELNRHLNRPANTPNLLGNVYSHKACYC